MVSSSGAYISSFLSRTEVPSTRLRAGVHLVVGPRPLWEALLADSREESGRLILLSPDPPPRDEARPPALRRVWFRGTAGRGSVSARASSLSQRVSQLALPSAVTALEGLEVLLFWNTLEEVVEFLRVLDARLVRCGSHALVYLRPRLIDARKHAALTAQFPTSIDLGGPRGRNGKDWVGPEPN